MTDSRYAIPVDDLVDSARVEPSEQVETQAEPMTTPGDWSPALYPHGVGGGSEVDGD